MKPKQRKRPGQVEAGASPWKQRLFVIIFESDTPLGKLFDVLLLVTILLSVSVVMLESVHDIRMEHEHALHVAEWVFTILFTIEYILRLLCVLRPGQYAKSFFGIVDLLAVLPTYISLFMTGAQYLMVVRVMRMLRIFRIFKLVHFLTDADVLLRALRESRRKIMIFIWTVISLVIVIGALMYLIEGEENGFTSIPRGVYWAIVTLTTVGYGDISPSTPLGQFVASFVMILGYGIIAVPTSIVTVEMHQAALELNRSRTKKCPKCPAVTHDKDAEFCRQCGGQLTGPGRKRATEK